ncbi:MULTISPECIES: hypothetical protein [Micromonospora]|uniref:hypothetical protein n=1 Tax=Micromonospora TaxID=1873 RepID=UPI000A67DC46|nr:hypothetical protein [Micromonospora globosa]
MTLIGWCPGGRKVADMLDTYRGTGVARIFVGRGDPLPAWDSLVLGPLVAASVPVHLSYKTNPVPDVVAWSRRKPPGLRLFLTEDHEPEQGPESGDPTLDEFHAAWGTLVPAFDAHPMRDEIWLGPVFTRYWWQKVAGDRRWLPKVPVDFVGWDVYSDVGYRTPDDLLTIPRAVAAETGVPYLVAELGAKAGPGRAAWMRAMVEAIAADGALTCCWFHKDEWDLSSSPDRTTWQTIILEEAPVTTTAPKNLLDARRLLLNHLDIHPGKVVAADLDPAEVGIVGDPAHRGGYHCGSDRVVPRDYSVIESARDRAGLAKWACALDVGEFSVRSGGTTHNLRTFSAWLVAQCKAGTADTRDIREVIYSTDGKTVRRWDRLGKRTTGDSSHRWHTHISYFRDAIKAGRDQTALMRRYLTHIGLIKPPAPPPAPTPVEDDMEQTDKLTGRTDNANRTVGAVLADLANLRNWLLSPVGAQDGYTAPAPGSPLALLLSMAAGFPAATDGIRERLDQVAAEVADKVLAGLPDGDTGPVSRAELVAAIREVLAGLAVPAS